MRVLAGLLLLWLAGAAQAHPLAPALLELIQIGPEHYEVRWRTSVSRVGAVELAPRWPPGCALRAPLAIVLSDERDALEARGTLHCPGLAGRAIAIDSLERAGIATIVRVEFAGGAVQQALLDARSPSWMVPAPDSVSALFANYLVLGFTHLALGPDHLLLVIGLVWLLRGWVRLLWALSVFTLGHSLTLAAASLGWIEFDPRLAELAIAASLLWLAVEVARGDGSGLFARHPHTLALGFGLVHGLGFAATLAGLGLPDSETLLALFAFNVGIELGQIAIVALLLGLLHAVRRAPAARLVRLLPAYGIGTMAAYWCFERGAAWWV